MYLTLIKTQCLCGVPVNMSSRPCCKLVAYATDWQQKCQFVAYTADTQQSLEKLFVVCVVSFWLLSYDACLITQAHGHMRISSTCTHAYLYMHNVTYVKYVRLCKHRNVRKRTHTRIYICVCNGSCLCSVEHFLCSEMRLLLYLYY